jgi:hypothetical protein
MHLAGCGDPRWRCFNNAVDLVRSQNPGIDAFQEARRLTTWHYHWLILKEFLPLFVGQAMVDDVLRNGRRFYLPPMVDPAGEGQSDPVDLRGGARAPRRFIGWETFFNFADGNVRPNKLIDTNISTPLFNLPLGTIPDGSPPTSLAARNLLHGVTWSLPSGQAMETSPSERPQRLTR